MRNPLTNWFRITIDVGARKRGRYGHRDATMILIGYRHGLRASELCDLQWHQIELNAGRLHVHRVKNGRPFLTEVFTTIKAWENKPTIPQ